MMNPIHSLKKLYFKIISWYFSRKALPYWCVLLLDCMIVLASLLTAYTISHGVVEVAEHLSEVFLSLCCYLLCYLLTFRIFRTYTGIIRYSSFIDLFRLLSAVLIGSLFVVLLRVFAHSDTFFEVITVHDLLVGSFIATILMWAVRISVKLIFESRSMASGVVNAMIYGSRKGGVSLAKSIRNQMPAPYDIRGFITNYPDMVGHTLMNKPIIGDTDSKLWDFIKEENVRVVIISPLVTDFFVNECQEMINRLIKMGVRIMMMPREQEWDGKSDLSHNQLREVSVEDLLPREKIDVDMESIGKMLNGQRILITGAAGSIGSEMARQIARFSPSELVLVDQAETPMHDVRLYMSRNHGNLKVWTIVGSITNQEHMEKIFSEHKPEYVFHAAAYKHVPMMEDNPAMAVQNNVYGTRVIADLAVKYGTRKFVMISTDKAVNPTNVMGCSKRICEIYCQSLNNKLWEETQRTGIKTTQFITTRFGNVLGSNGSVIPIFSEQIKKGGPVTVTHPDIIRFFMLIPEACRLVLEAGTMGNGGEIFVFDMGKPVRIADMARRMIELSGAKGIEIKFTGLRDGEKLYEEVLNDEEETKPTKHPKIKVAAVREYPYDLALANEKELHELSFSFDDMKIVAKMKEIVPEYKSRHSKYEALDK